MSKINPHILLWARETSGMDVEEAAKKLQFRDTRLVSAQDKLLMYEHGDLEPNQGLLSKMAKVYRRPLLTFYLEAPPTQGDRGNDFRRTVNDQAPAYDPKLDALVRDVLVRHELVLAVKHEEDEDTAPLNYVGSKAMKQGVDDVLKAITTRLQITTETYRQHRNAEEGFAYLRTQAENAGIFVVLIGNLGHHTNAVPVTSFRGYAIANPLAPFIVINDQDAKTAWSFTLMHELAHIWLGATGVSDGSEGAAIEKFCNEVASSFFVKNSELMELAQSLTSDSDHNYYQIEAFAADRKISRSMVAYNLFKVGAITKDQWQSTSSYFETLWKEEQKRKKAKPGGAVDYYTVRKHRLGKALVGFVKRAIDENILTPTKAGRVLGVKPRAVSILTDREITSGGIG